MIHVNKERLGDFIGSERKNLGLTQRDLAARLHVHLRLPLADCHRMMQIRPPDPSLMIR